MQEKSIKSFILMLLLKKVNNRFFFSTLPHGYTRADLNLQDPLDLLKVFLCIMSLSDSSSWYLCTEISFWSFLYVLPDLILLSSVVIPSWRILGFNIKIKMSTNEFLSPVYQKHWTMVQSFLLLILGRSVRVATRFGGTDGTSSFC
jgi:hypothetical protein